MRLQRFSILAQPPHLYEVRSVKLVSIQNQYTFLSAAPSPPKQHTACQATRGGSVRIVLYLGPQQSSLTLLKEWKEE